MMRVGERLVIVSVTYTHFNHLFSFKFYLNPSSPFRTICIVTAIAIVILISLFLSNWPRVLDARLYKVDQSSKYVSTFLIRIFPSFCCVQFTLGSRLYNQLRQNLKCQRCGPFAAPAIPFVLRDLTNLFSFNDMIFLWGRGGGLGGRE